MSVTIDTYQGVGKLCHGWAAVGDVYTNTRRVKSYLGDLLKGVEM